MMGAREVLRSCAGWLMVSASSMTSWRDLASSKILSISLWTSADNNRGGKSAWYLADLTCRNKSSILSCKYLFLAHKKNQGQLCFNSPRLERVLDLSMMAFLFSTERFASDRSAVTRVIEILWNKTFLITSHPQLLPVKRHAEPGR